jgi:hypothetical protein
MRKSERKTIFVGGEIYLLTRGGLISVGFIGQRKAFSSNFNLRNNTETLKRDREKSALF